MAALTTQTIVAAGTAPTFAAPSASDTAEVGSGVNTFAVYKNTSATPTNVVVIYPGNLISGDAVPDKTYTLADGSSTPTEVWIPLRKEYADSAVAGVGRCTITTDNQTGITAAIVRMG